MLTMEELGFFIYMDEQERQQQQLSDQDVSDSAKSDSCQGILESKQSRPSQS